MLFTDKLQEYMRRLPCTARELAEAGGLSAAAISRYQSGQRRPAPESPQLAALARGIAAVAASRGLPEYTEDAVLQELSALLREEKRQVQDTAFTDNLNALVDRLGIRNIDLSRILNFDASYLSKVRAGERRFSDPLWCAAQISRYVVQKFPADDQTAGIAALVGPAYAGAADANARAEILSAWMTSGHPPRGKKGVSRFLQILDEFDLEQYARQIHFDSLKVPPAVAQLPAARFYSGLKEMMEAELRFLKTTVLSRRNDSVVLYSDMPMQEMSKNEDFKKKWLLGLALMLRKGLHLHSVHNVDRPLEEMLLGLEAWIPMYMTGQISPYYLSGVQNNVFLHFLRVSGAAAIEGSAIAGHQGEGRYYLTSRRQELAGYRTRADRLLEKAKPLMHIYREDAAEDFRAFRDREEALPGDRRSILSALPLHTITDGLLKKLLARNKVPADEAESICRHAQQSRVRMQELLAHSTVDETVPLLSEEEFAAYPMCLPLADLFSARNIIYTYELYSEHLALTQRFAGKNSRYTCRLTENPMFRNIQIQILAGQWALVSKNNSPAIHFVIRHPRLVQAIENLRQ